MCSWDEIMPCHTHTMAKWQYGIEADRNGSLRTDTLELETIQQETNAKQGACSIIRRSGQLCGRGCNWHCAGLYLSQNCELRSSTQLWKYNESNLQKLQVEMHTAGCIITYQSIKYTTGCIIPYQSTEAHRGLHNHAPSYNCVGYTWSLFVMSKPTVRIVTKVLKKG